MRKIQKFLKVLFVLSLLFVGIENVAFADDVPVNIAVTGITLNEHSATLTVGETDQLTATILPPNATNTSVTWNSSDEGVATVSDGLVTGVAVGNTTITVTTTDGSFTDTDLITVDRAPINHLNVEADIDVPASCNATDTDGVLHDYPKGDSYLAICALEEALKNGSISSVELSNQFPALGLFITTINDVVADPSSQYWTIYQNGDFAQLGLTSLPLVVGDIIMLQLHDFSDNNLGDQVILNIHSLTPISSGGGHHHGGGGSTTNTTGEVLGTETKASFDLEKALNFVVSQQKEDSSFGEDIYTDWATIALVSGNKLEPVIKLIKYFGENNIKNMSLTDYERHAMALMSLGLNPYNTNKENYIEKITTNFDGKQFGDLHEDNDDIFALIVLLNAGYTQDDKIINDDVSFVVGAQRENGSWDGSVDMTGAAIEALSTFNSNEQTRPNPARQSHSGGDLQVGQVKNALLKAKNFLKQNQKDTGGWDNASSTAWAMEGILALNEKVEDWKKGENTPLDYLATIQDIDGGIKDLTRETDQNIQNKIWETAYVISALSGKTWNQLMQKFEKPKDIGSILGASTELKTKTVLKKVTVKPKIETQKKITVENKAENTATVNNVLPENPSEPKPKKENWFMRFLKFIF